MNMDETSFDHVWNACAVLSMSAIYCPPPRWGPHKHWIKIPANWFQSSAQCLWSSMPRRSHAVARVASDVDLKCATDVFKKTEPLHASILLTSSCTWKQLNNAKHIHVLGITWDIMRSQMRYIGYPVSYPISYHIISLYNLYNTYIRCLTGLNWNFQHRGKQTQLGWDSAANQIARCKFTTCVGEVWQNGQRNPGFSQSACAVWAFSTQKKDEKSKKLRKEAGLDLTTMMKNNSIQHPSNSIQIIPFFFTLSWPYSDGSSTVASACGREEERPP